VVTAIRASGSVTLTHNERSFTDLPTAFACTAEAQFCQNNDVIHLFAGTRGFRRL
jgi:hypothetical protein